MTLNVVALNTSNSIMYSRETTWQGALYGFPVESSFLQHTEIINYEDEIMELVTHIIPHFTNYFGLILDNVYDNRREYVRPNKM